MCSRSKHQEFGPEGRFHRPEAGLKGERPPLSAERLEDFLTIWLRPHAKYTEDRRGFAFTNKQLPGLSFPGSLVFH